MKTPSLNFEWDRKVNPDSLSINSLSKDLKRLFIFFKDFAAESDYNKSK